MVSALIHFLFSIVTFFITERSILFGISCGHFLLSRFECDVFICIFETASELTCLCPPLNSGLPMCELVACVNFQDYGFLQVFKASVGLRIFFSQYQGSRTTYKRVRNSRNNMQVSWGSTLLYPLCLHCEHGSMASEFSM